MSIKNVFLRFYGFAWRVKNNIVLILLLGGVRFVPLMSMMAYDDLFDFHEQHNESQEESKKDTLAFFCKNPDIFWTYIAPCLSIHEINNLSSLSRYLASMLTDSEGNTFLHCLVEERVLACVASVPRDVFCFFKKVLLQRNYEHAAILLSFGTFDLNASFCGYVTIADFIIAMLRYDPKQGDFLLRLLDVVIKNKKFLINKESLRNQRFMGRLMEQLQLVCCQQDYCLQEIKDYLIKAFQLILQYDHVDINYVDNQGWSLLHHAALLGEPVIIHALLKRKDINSNIISRNGMRPIDVMNSRHPALADNLRFFFVNALE